MNAPDQQIIYHDTSTALMEDGAWNDISSRLFDPDATHDALAEVVAQEHMLLAGVEWFSQSFQNLSKKIHITWHFKEGTQIKKGQLIASIKGPAHIILSAERVALNFLQLISGVATQTAQYVSKIKALGFDIKILDTRKTIPNMRYAQKYAVQVAGGHNHRFDLRAQLMLKDNHIHALGGIQKACKKAYELFPKSSVIIEVDHLSQIESLLQIGLPGQLLLDNFLPTQIQQALALCKGQCRIEVSGGITLDNLPQYLIKGVDYISLGALTKNVQAIDLSLHFIDK